ncbi:PREDICTED: uncharacterized protein LOC109158328 [Ipomoea nil]|uniref:uncharacterized protein LOC109158328 n=1 Tax=Ipomoea nil TaxID=35883 RepID=UPI0009018793|nr:PREDICTED: uncharacterized protein LOC109158328 [Ipomoea nil]
MEATKKQGGNGHHDLHVQAVWFAAGTAALMACLERAVVVSFVEQWRVLVFLALNLLLLAILFTSTRPNSPPETLINTPIISCTTAEEADEAAIEKEAEAEAEEDAEDPVDDLKSADMSKEELNERAEAFIAMFRQHLASDAFAFHKTTTNNLTFCTQLAK